MTVAEMAIAGTAIEVRGLRQAYGEKVAVDGLDLAVARGERPPIKDLWRHFDLRSTAVRP